MFIEGNLLGRGGGGEGKKEEKKERNLNYFYNFLMVLKKSLFNIFFFKVLLSKLKQY